uniref:HNH endonuclease n=1 Tax=uncultured marine virus TaxID=186617 RepID=A0A0F7L7R8_9VIRU|nr:hypothetical protein [uncultured marine virus]
MGVRGQTSKFKEINNMYIENKYNRFLNSEWWKMVRNRKYSLFEKKCEKCSSEKNLNIHHASYLNTYAGRINKAIKHTNTLCRECHHEFHKKYGVKKDMRKETKKFITGWGF